ncbi:MAG: hypothetical protein AzoDbin1_05153 [Azoarcus sp.]|nr:hypothetical protein [Azoarcus sp.]
MSNKNPILHSFWLGLTRAEREAVAERAGMTFYHLRNIVYAANGRQISPEKALAIAKATGGLVSADDLCPGFDWQYIRQS